MRSRERKLGGADEVSERQTLGPSSGNGYDTMKLPRHSCIRVALCALLTLLMTPSGSAQDQEEPLRAPQIERERVLFVTLDLSILKKVRRQLRGAPGITRDDLLVIVRGKQVPIELFEDWCPSVPPTAVEVRKAERAGEPSPAREDLEPLRYIVYFELGHLSLEGLNRAFDAALEWVRTIRPEDEVMVVSAGQSLRIIRMLRPASEGLEADLLAAMRDYGLTGGWAEGGVGRAAEIDGLAGQGSTLPGMEGVGDPDASATNLATNYAQMEFSSARRALENMKSLMVLFDRIEGTKNLVLFQDDLRFNPGSQYAGAEFQSDVDAYIRPLVRAANERNVRFYPVVARGMSDRVGAFADHADPAMTLLASETGGRVVEGTNDLRVAFEMITEDSSCFYRIGFRFPSRQDGTTRRIQVLVNGGHGYEVRYRQTFQDLTDEQQETDRIQAAFLDPTGAVSFPISAVAVPLFDQERGRRVRVQVQVDAGELLALRGDVDAREARVQLGGVILPRLGSGPVPEQGIMSQVNTRRTPWRFASGGILQLPQGAVGEGRLVALVEEIHVPPGDYFLIGVVQDELAQTLGSLVVPFEVPAKRSALGPVHLASAGDGTLFIEPETKASNRKRRGRSKQIGPAPLSLPDGVLVRDEPTFRAGEAVQIVYAVCDPAATEDDVFQGWSMQRRLTCDDGNVVPLAGQRVSIPQEENCFLIVEPIAPGTVNAGECRYEVVLERPQAAPERRELQLAVLPARS